MWPGAVLRGDMERISVGADTSFQDGAIVHAEPGTPVVHRPRLRRRPRRHRARRRDRRRLPGRHARHAAQRLPRSASRASSARNALVLRRRAYPPRSLLIGSPAKVARELTDEELEPLAGVRGRYTARGRLYTEQGLGADLSAFRR